MNRIAWLVLAFAMLALPVVAGEPEAKGDDKGKTEHRRPPMGMIGKFILDHAKELALTDEQKTKIEAILKDQGDNKPPKPEPKPEGKAEGKHGKGPFADILTEEQHNKLRELLKAEHPPKDAPPQK